MSTVARRLVEAMTEEEKTIVRAWKLTPEALTAADFRFLADLRLVDSARALSTTSLGREVAACLLVTDTAAA